MNSEWWKTESGRAESIKRKNTLSTNQANKKLFPLDVINIHWLMNKGHTCREMGKMYGFVPFSISSAIQGKTWKNIHDIIVCTGWKPEPFGMKSIPGFSNYLISKEGKIWSRKALRYLNPWMQHGYLQIQLEKFTKSVAPLLLSTFDRLPNPGEVCRHLNDVKLDNRLTNLAWGTQYDNIQDAIRNASR